MAHVSYLARREGRYYLQVRCGRTMAGLLNQPLFRTSLRTSDYRQARRRIAECLGWIYGMNDSVDFAALFAKNVRQLQSYLDDRLPVSDERLFARRNYEELLKNLNRRAQAREFEVSVAEPGYRALFEAFVAQNLEAEGLQRQRERMVEYERGRSDVTTGIAMGIIAVPGGGASRFAEAIPREPYQVTRTDAGIIEPVPLVPSHVEPVPLPRTETQLSVALEEYLIGRHSKHGHDSERGEVGLIVQFMIDQLGDPPAGAITREQFNQIERMLPDIPNRKGVPRQHQSSLTTRYDYARTHGWEGLQRLTEARLRKGYHASLAKFFRWLTKEGYHTGPQLAFSHLSSENLVSLPRDSFDEREVLKIFQLPLFTGCLSRTRIWQPGRYFIQNELYWAYLLALMTGMRPSEIGQLRISDFEASNGHVLINLQLFDPKLGRVARKDTRQLKTGNAIRKIPLHPLIVDLGLLDRVEALKAIGCDVLFPEWEPYRKPSGEMRWGQPISKSWQYMKKKLGLTRADISVYSARHWMADQLDDLVISQRTRQRVMGHANHDDMPGRYGAKGRYSSQDLAELTGLGSDVLDELSDSLLTAKHRAGVGELTVLQPWLQRNQWSRYYREKFDQQADRHA